LNINVYTREVGSDTPTISSGCPPRIDWMIPQIDVDTNVCTAVISPSITGIHNMITISIQD
jgi:hypothetical protein